MTECTRLKEGCEMMSLVPVTRTLDQVVDVLRGHLKLLAPGAPVPPGASLRDLGLDSMGAMNLLFDLERTFRIVFPDELVTAESFRDAESLARTVGALAALKGGA
jgi:acyl carrier protein